MARRIRTTSRTTATRAAGPLALALAALLAGCATTTVSSDPAAAPALAACDPSASALVLWAPRWRADQKDVPDREAAARAGLQAFLDGAGCFARAELRRVEADRPAVDQATAAAAADPSAGRVLVVHVRELGPVLRLFDSPALVRGGTEVVLDLAVAAPQRRGEAWRVRWQHGGPGVVRGVGGLAADMRRALEAALQAPAPGAPTAAGRETGR